MKQERIFDYDSKNSGEEGKRGDQQKHSEESSIMIDTSFSASESEQSEAESTSSSQESDQDISEDEVEHRNHKRVSPMSVDQVETIQKKVRTSTLPMKETAITKLKKAEYCFALGLDVFR